MSYQAEKIEKIFSLASAADAKISSIKSLIETSKERDILKYRKARGLSIWQSLLLRGAILSWQAKGLKRLNWCMPAKLRSDTH